MKQVLQSLDSGNTEVVDLPSPKVKPKHILIQSRASLVSIGTERMLVDFGKANLIDKARQQPDRVKQVVQKMTTDGVGPTINTIKSKLSQPVPLGYCNAGVVIDLGSKVKGFRVGDRVISNGPHAEVVSVAHNLCAKIPDTDQYIKDEEAAFTVLASIGLQGLRLANPTIGESFVVTGLGLIGLLTVQLLKAQGCRVLGIDFDSRKVALAGVFGAETVDLSKSEDPIVAAQAFSKGRGVDGVLITASTRSSEPVRQAAEMCRKRGRIVLVGVTGLELSRADFYEKELSFQVSCSYGPGRYDPNYEDKGNDYPLPYVRWTEGRNFEAVLDLMAENRLDISSLISHRINIDEAAKAYELVSEDKSVLGIVLNYPEMPKEELLQSTVRLQQYSNNPSRLSIGVIGAGNFTTQMLLPALQKKALHLHTIASSGGVSGLTAARKFSFEQTTTDTNILFSETDINTIFVTTRHNTHAQFVLNALEAGKHVFVEKPLAINRAELKTIVELYETLHIQGKPPYLGIGFNRRFAPHIVKMKALINSVKEPKTLVMTVNAGSIPSDHWTQDLEIGGGRIIGEVCHFVDILRHLVGASIVKVQAMKLESEAMVVTDDKVTITLGFEDGSLGTVHYFANGDKSFPKERIEVFVANRILALDNFRKLKAYGWPNFKGMKLMNQNKGHSEGVHAFVDAIANGTPAPIAFEEIVEVSRVMFDIVDQLHT